MKCGAVQRKLSEYLDGDLPAHEQAAIAAHLETCTRCRAEAAVLRRDESALETLAAFEAAPELMDDLRRRLAAPVVRRFRLAWIGAAVVAAGAVAACVLWLSQPAAPPQAALPEGPASASRVTVERSEPARPVTEEEPARVVSHVRHQARPQPPRTVEKSTEQTPPTEVVEAPPVAAVKAPSAKQPGRFVADAAPADVPVSPYGIILLLGEPAPILPSSKCYLEVSFPDGAKSIVDRSVERDAAGQPRAIRVTYQNTAPENERPNQGG